MLDFRMDTFLAVCRHMNYTKAARELHITQPAVTQHIHFIEKEYGVQLFSFHGKKLSLTPEGRRLLGAVTTMKHDDMALRRMFDEGKTGRRQLTFGVTMTIGEYVIGKYLASYIRRHPGTRIRLYIANTEELLGRLDRGEIDFALVEGFFEKRDYDFRLFRRERYLGVCAPGLLEEREAPRNFQEIFTGTLITREPGSGTREVLERALSEKGWGIDDFSNVVEISSMGAIKRMAEGGGGIAFLYEAAVLRELEEGSLVPVYLEDFPRYHDFTFIWRKNSLFGGQYMELLDEMEREQMLN